MIVALTVGDLLIGDVLGQKEVLGNDIVDFSLDRRSKLVISHVNLDDIGVALQRVLQCASIGVINEVARDIKLFDSTVQLQEFRERLAEHVTETVRGE